MAKINGKDIYLTLLKGQGFEHKGEYNSTAVYEKTTQTIDCFTYNGTTYYTKQTAPAGTLPTDTTYFGVMAEKGDKGETGEKGVDGVSVTNATAGTPTNSGDTTTTPITFEFSNGNTKTVNVTAQKGEKGDKGDAGESGGSDKWITLYDKDSEDDTVNWGYTAGLVALTGLISNSADFTGYHFMRVYYVVNGAYSNCQDFDISKASVTTETITKNFTLERWDNSIMYLFGQTVALQYQADSGKHLFHVGTGRQWFFKNNAYPQSTALSTNSAFFIEKIQVK